MARVSCPYCGASNQEGEQLCQDCFRRLPVQAPHPADAEPEPAADPDAEPAAEPAPDADAAPGADPDADPEAGLDAGPEADADAEPEETPNCPHCGAEVPDPANRVCVECHEPLRGVRSLRLSFPGGEVTVRSGQTVALGRDPAGSPVAGVFADRDNVSRLHATLGIDDDGAWVRDERSTNGTYVNDVPVPAGIRVTLAAGDTLRLAADLSATVQTS